MSRAGLALLALAGDVALTITQVFPIAAVIVVGALFVNVVWVYWASGAAIVLFVWLLRPSLRFDGRELLPAEAPELFRELEALNEKLRVTGRMRVYLDESFNASAAETKGLLGIVGTTRALTLGIPLLATLDRRQMLAVIAHEFGHFSRRHGVLGHWLYRARIGWTYYARQIDASDSALDQAAAWYARRFAPFFSDRCFAHSRECEYEADADAVAAAGADAFAQALTRIGVVGRFWEERLPEEIAAWQKQLAEPPADFQERFATCIERLPAGELQSLLGKELAEPPRRADTHPNLAERLQAAGQPAQLTAPAESAGASWFGPAWAPLVHEFNAKWAKQSRREWFLEHLRAKHRVEHAPSEARGKFAHAAALLEKGASEGAALMESLAREAPAFRVEAFRRVLRFHERREDRMQVERWSAWLDRAAVILGDTLREFVTKAEAGSAGTAVPPGALRTALAEAVGMDACVRGIVLLQGEAALAFAADRPSVPLTVYLLALSIDPRALEQAGEDEEHVRMQYQEFLRRAVAPDEAFVVRTFYTTEDLPAAYSQ